MEEYTPLLTSPPFWSSTPTRTLVLCLVCVIVQLSIVHVTRGASLHRFAMARTSSTAAKLYVAMALLLFFHISSAHNHNSPDQRLPVLYGRRIEFLSNYLLLFSHSDSWFVSLSVCLIVCRRQQVHIYPVFCKTGHFTVTIIIDQSLIESHMRAYHVTNFCMNPFVGLK